MFNVFSQTGVPGFRVRPEDDVPGFDIDENGLPRRDRPWPDGMGPGSTTPQYPDLARAMMATPGPEGLVQPAPPQHPDWLYKLLTMSLPASPGAFAPLSGPRPAPYGTPINPVSFYPTTDQNMRQMGDASGGSRTGQWPSFDAPKPLADIETRDGAATARNAYPPPAGQEAMGDAWPQPLEDGRTYAQAGAAGPQDLSGAEMALPRREGPWSDGAPTGISTPQAVTPVNCTTVNGSLDCTSPGGVSFSGGVKASPGFPERLDSTTEDKHAYSVPDGPYQDSTRTMRQDVINYPTPGPTKLVRPATPEGTLNEATPELRRALRHSLRRRGDHPERRRGVGKLAGIALSAHASSGLDKQRLGGSLLETFE